MLKLKKIKSSELIGERSGFEKSRWTVAGYENVTIREFAGMWIAHDNHTGLVIDCANTRKELVAVLETKLPHHPETIVH
ncbi:MAG: hypothetical protein VX192_11785 [Pseudomonadota bacterium]|nr:hypothetical protein [Pseudomonadota bacterium]MEC7992043.1 hypothetical protein [Pseudomonadota bacterium]